MENVEGSWHKHKGMVLSYSVVIPLRKFLFHDLKLKMVQTTAHSLISQNKNEELTNEISV